MDYPTKILDEISSLNNLCYEFREIFSICSSDNDEEYKIYHKKFEYEGKYFYIRDGSIGKYDFRTAMIIYDILISSSLTERTDIKTFQFKDFIIESVGCEGCSYYELRFNRYIVQILDVDSAYLIMDYFMFCN